jgi:soluble lytic murein transglycosylase-like protein
MPATASGSFGSVQLPDWNFLLDTADGKTTADVARTQIGNEGGKLANQLASATLGSNTQIAANAAEGGSLANQYAGQRNPLEITLLKQQTGQESSPVFDKLLGAVNGGGGQPAGPGASTNLGQPQSLLSGNTPVAADPQTQADVVEEAKRQGVNPDWASRTYYAEHGAQKTPYGPGSTSSAGAIGPMQLMPGTAADLKVDPNDYKGNIKGGVAYMKQMKDRYDSPVLATAAYNAGPGRVDAFLAGKAPLPAETIAYVGKIFGTDGQKIISAAMSGQHGHTIPGVQIPGVQTATGAVPVVSQPQPAAAPGVTVAPESVAAVPASAPVQVATRGPIVGDTASDAVPAGAAQPPAPGFDAAGNPLPAGSWDASSVSPPAAGQGVDAVMTRLRAGQPQIQNPNALLSVAAPDGSVAQPAPNALAGSAAPAPGQPQPPQAPPPLSLAPA